MNAGYDLTAVKGNTRTLRQLSGTPGRQGIAPHAEPPERTESLEALRYYADQLSGLVTRLHQSDESGAPPISVESAESVLTRLIRHMSRRSVKIQTSYAVLPLPRGLRCFYEIQREVLARNSACDVLFAHDMLADVASSSLPARLLERGADVRVHQCTLPTMTIVDGAVALLGSLDEDQAGRVRVVRDRSVVEVMRTLFAAAWDSSVTLSSLDGVDVDWEGSDVALRVLELLGSGYTDEAGARKLGLSVRTYRRYVADVMGRLNARSRFHAGILAARLGMARAGGLAHQECPVAQ